MVTKENQQITLNISGYEADGRQGKTINSVTFGNGVSIYAKTYTAADIKTDAATFYGAYLSNYTSENDQYIKDGQEGEYWKIFYSDNDHIYLISSNYIHYNGMPTVMVNGVEKSAAAYTGDDLTTYPYSGYFINVIGPYTGTNDIAENVRYLNKNYFEFLNGSNANQRNTQAMAYMLDTAKWSGYVGNNSDWAIGGPSLELLLDSYNDKYYPVARNLVAGSVTANHTTADTITTNGYKYSINGGTNWNTIGAPLNSTDSLYCVGSENSNGCNLYWLSSPSANQDYYMYYITYSGTLYSGFIGNRGYSFRPVVRLNSGLTLKMVSEGHYRIVE